MAEYNVTFRNISAERLAMIVLAGKAKADHGHAAFAEPEVEVVPDREEKWVRTIRLGTCAVDVVMPLGSNEDQVLADLAERLSRGKLPALAT